MSLCAYESDVVIVSGFDCPPAYAVRVDGAHGTICAEDWVDPHDPQLCSMVGCDGLQLRLPPMRAECEGLDPTHCLAPWPSDRYRDASGLLAIPGEALPTDAGSPLDTHAWSRSDGFAPSTPLVVVVDGAIDASRLPGEDQLEASLDDASPTVVLDVSVSPPRRVAHVAELDAWSEGTSRSTIWIRPLSLEPGHRIVVAVRALSRPDGTPVAPALPFRALRDRLATDQPSLEARRAGFESDVLAPLAAAGIDRASLHLAWTFHVASSAVIDRDLAATAPSLGAACVVGAVTTASDGTMTVRGTFDAPRFDASEAPDAPIVRAADGTPALQRMEARPFVVVVPAPVVSAARPVRALVLGHVLGGTADDVVMRPEWRRFAGDRGAVLVATDLAGTSASDTDASRAGAGGDPASLVGPAERSLEAALALASLARALPACATDARLSAYLDASSIHLVALEESGALVPAVASLDTPIDGIVMLGPPGAMAAWARRSYSGVALDDALAGAYADPTDRAMFVAALATPWQSVEAVDGSGRATRRVLSLSLVDSYRAPPLLARLTASALGLPLLVPSVEVPQLTPTSLAPTPRAWIALDGGLSRTTPGAARPPHDRMLESSAPYARPVADMLDAFLRADGGVIDACGGACAL